MSKSNSYNLSPDMLRGSVCVQFVRCGKPNCRCASGASLHGPYHYLMYRERGRQRKRYVRQSDVQAVTAACARGRSVACASREAQKESRVRSRPLLHDLARWL
ncbi:MAG TPA: DUF6788 family protein [Pyrinomonadaceae bacterium]|nr:DUF6788 family protein [Pyrinomonadaceae bacterium]